MVRMVGEKRGFEDMSSNIFERKYLHDAPEKQRYARARYFRIVHKKFWLADKETASLTID